mmetsp:Transcript_19075/g.26428  ORF Transcript_19075/g.26428 Transcript_19075/m.26428 type:complete len:248 (+) Transcript_19075:1758-2501(+)
MNGTEKDTTFSIDIGAVFGAEGSLEHERRTDGNTPSKSEVSGLSANVLVDSERGVNSGTVNFLSLFIKTTDGRSHSLGADSNNIHIFREFLTDGVKVSKKESVRKSKSGTRLHGGEDFLVKLCLGSIGNKENDKIRLLDNFEHFSESSFVGAETTILGFLERRRSLTKTNGNINTSIDFIKRIPNVLGLGGCLGSPSNNTDFLDTLEGLGKKREKITSSLNNSFLGISKCYLTSLEHTGFKGHLKSC